MRDCTTVAFEVIGPALLRGGAHEPVDLPPWPDPYDRTPAGVAAGQQWLRQVWANPRLAEAISHASPDLADAVQRQLNASPISVDPDRVSRSVFSVARYLLRMRGRPSPFGLLAGVAPAGFGPAGGAGARWGEAHRAVAQPAAYWLANVLAELEADPRLLHRLRVIANSTMTVRGDHLVVAHQPAIGDDRRPVPTELAIRLTPALSWVLDAARSPVLVEDLVAKLHAQAPTVPADHITAMLATLVTRRVLITNLHAPSTETDPLDHLVRILESAAADDLDSAANNVAGRARSLRRTVDLLTRHNTSPPADQPAIRQQLADTMRTQSPGLTGHPLALDLRLDAGVVLPRQVAADVEQAALVLARLSEYPYGMPAWRDYHRAFYERYGIGALVPVQQVVDPDSGIGFPAGYPGTLVEAPAPKVKERDEVLLALAQTAALDGGSEIVLDDALIAALDRGPARPRLPSHLELGIRINAPDQQSLRQGRYSLEITQVSRNVGGLTGRFLSVLGPDDAHQHVVAITSLPGPDPSTLHVQASFPPLDPATGHVARAPHVLPTLLSLAEHRTPEDRPNRDWPKGRVLTVDDLAIGCDGRRLYLAAPAWGRRIEVSVLHALNPRMHTPALARFLTELTRAQCTLMTGLRWGVAGTLPYRPRVRHGRVILAPATWRLTAAELLGPAADPSRWAEELAAWRQRRRMPAHVRLVVDDKRLLLDLDQPGHRTLLRRHLQTNPNATLTEVIDPDGAGWCANRPHEVIVALRASAPPPWPPLPTPSPARVIRRGHGDTLGASPIVYAQLYGDLRRQDVLLAEHLPRLLAELGPDPRWWFLRYRDADRLDPHLRLRIRLTDPVTSGPTVQIISTWADELHRAGLLREVRYPTSYSETGRWGSGPVLAAAENVFAADSAAVLAQLQQPRRPGRQALIAAHTVAIVAAFLGSPAAGMHWLIDRIPAAAPSTPVPRPSFTEVVRIANPENGFAALRAEPGGNAIVDAWRPRDTALAAWRAHLDAPTGDAAGITVADALGHLVHGHYIRAYGIDFDDEPICMYLARAAALAWTACNRRTHP